MILKSENHITSSALNRDIKIVSITGHILSPLIETGSDL